MTHKISAKWDTLGAVAVVAVVGPRGQWPEAHLDPLELPAIAQVRVLQRGRIDLGLMLPPVEGAAIIDDPVWSEASLAVLPEAHPLVRRSNLYATDFDSQDVVIGHVERGPRRGRHVLDLLDTLHANVRTVAEVEHLQIELMLVQAGAGITLVSGALARVSIEGIVFRPFTPARGRNRRLCRVARHDDFRACGAIPGCRARGHGCRLTKRVTTAHRTSSLLHEIGSTAAD